MEDSLSGSHEIARKLFDQKFQQIVSHHIGNDTSADLSAQLIAETVALAEISHQQKHTGKRYAERHQIGHASKRVVEAMEQSGKGERQGVERLAIARIEMCEAYEVTTNATPQGMEKRQRGEAGYVEEESRGVIGLHVDGGLLLHSFEHTEGDARHQAVINQRLWQQRFAGTANEKQQGHHLHKLLGEAHAEHIAHNVEREGQLGEEIKEIEMAEPRENDEYGYLGEEEHAHRGLDIDLSTAEKDIEKQSPDNGEIERDGIEHQQAANGKEHEHRERQPHNGQDQQALVVEPVVARHIVAGKDKLRANGTQLFAQRSLMAHLRMVTARLEQFHYGGLTACNGVARLVVGQQDALLHIAGNHRLVVGAILV